MYPTGVSSQPIDFVSGGQAFFQSAVEQRLKDIEENKATVTENHKKVLEASSVKALPKLWTGLQQKYDKEIQTYRNEIVEKFKKSGGKLSTQDQMAIQNGKLDLEQRMLADVNEIEQWQSATDAIKNNPNLRYITNFPEYQKKLADYYSNKVSGKPTGNLSAELASTFQAPAVPDFIEKKYEPIIKGLNISAKARWQDANTFVFNTAQDEEEVDRQIDYVFSTDPFLKAQDTPEQRQAVKDAWIKNEAKFETYRPSAPRASSDRYRNATDYTPTPFNYKNNNYDIVPVPSDVTQTERNFFINNASNLDTGKKSQLTEDNAKIVGVDVERGVILLEGKGGKAQSGGKDLYIPEGEQPFKGDSGWQGDTEDTLKGKAAESTIKKKYKGKDRVREIADVKTEKDADGNIILSGTVVTKKERIPISIKYVTFTDPASQAIYTAPMRGNKTAVAAAFPDMNIDGRPLEWYFDNVENNPYYKNGVGGQSVNKPTGKTLSVSAYNKAKGTNVTKEQLSAQSWAKDYTIVD